MSSAIPGCPLCAAPMRYVAANGRWRGDFWGCTQYDKTGCRGKINVRDADAEPPSPGASAQARFERERTIHRAKLRGALPALTAAILVVMAMTFFGLLPIHPALASVGAIVAGMVGIFAIGRLPRDALYWDKGARGERKTAEYLQPLVDRGFVILHDRQVPGSRANIDHVAIGPSGVFVIETKYLSGTIEIINDKLFVSDRERQNYLDEVYREALAAQVGLSEVLNPLHLTITPILCIHGARVPWFDHAVAGVRLLSGQQLRKLADAGPQLLTAEQVQKVAAIAEARLRPMPSWER